MNIKGGKGGGGGGGGVSHIINNYSTIKIIYHFIPHSHTPKRILLVKKISTLKETVWLLKRNLFERII